MFSAVTLTAIFCLVVSEWLVVPSSHISFLFSRAGSTPQPIAARTYEPTERGLDAIHVQAPYYQRRNASCLIFSCSEPNYEMVHVGLAVNNRSNVVCDRAHFYVRTVSMPSGETVKPHWCRVALLASRSELFTAYETVMYVDADLVYSEEHMLEAAEKMPRFLISSKTQRGRDLLKTYWFVIAMGGDWIELVQKWALAWKDTYLQDQAVFNELFQCKDVDCVPMKADKVRIRHCGRFFKGKEREDCLWEGVEGRA